MPQDGGSQPKELREIEQMQLEKPWPCCLSRDLLGTRQHHSGIHLGSFSSSHHPDEITAFPLLPAIPVPAIPAPWSLQFTHQRQNKIPLGRVCLSQSRHSSFPGGQSWSGAAPRAHEHQTGSPGSQERALAPARPGKANLILLHSFRECRICKLSP